LDRLRHRIFTILAAISLVMCVAASVQWITCPAGGQTWHFTIDLGKPSTRRNLDLTFTRNLRFGLTHDHWIRWTIVHLTMPVAMVVLLSAILPIAWLVKRKAATPKGMCKVCGYDLRESPVRCPECGTTVQRNSPETPFSPR
jgi:hypothetical protein